MPATIRTGAPAQCVAGEPLVDTAGIQANRLSGQPMQTDADGSSLNRPYPYSVAGGAVLGNSVR